MITGQAKMATLRPGQSQQDAKSYEYYIKVVPTQLQKLNGKIYDSYQFVANSNEVVGRYRLPAIYFRYDMSPITTRFVEKRPPLYHFLVQICAIIGGVFTVMGMVNSSVLMVSKTFKDKIGKLG